MVFKRELEKQIAELERENADLRDNYDQFKASAIPEIERLGKQIEKMKCCLNCNFWKEKKYNVCRQIKKLGKICCTFWELKE